MGQIERFIEKSSFDMKSMFDHDTIDMIDSVEVAVEMTGHEIMYRRDRTRMEDDKNKGFDEMHFMKNKLSIFKFKVNSELIVFGFTSFTPYGIKNRIIDGTEYTNFSAALYDALKLL